MGKKPHHSENDNKLKHPALWNLNKMRIRIIPDLNLSFLQAIYKLYSFYKSPVASLQNKLQGLP